MHVITYRKSGEKLPPGKGGKIIRSQSLRDACKTALQLEKDGQIVLNIIRVEG